jgi:uncharacterized protein YbjT (DUF2867 family)
MTNRTALIVGATGLIGGFVLQALLSNPVYSHVTAITRKPLLTTHRKLKTIITKFNSNLENDLSSIQAQDVFCCLGTTIKKAGSQEAFKLVDHSLVLSIAEQMRQQGTEQFLVISAMGADPDSKIFYNRVKGDMENALRELDYPCLRIIRPSLLLGKRQEFRLGERIGVLLSPVLKPFMIGSLKKYAPVEAKSVAEFMVKIAGDEPISGIHIYESDFIR